MTAYLEGGTHNGSLELLGPLVPLLGDILLLSLLVLPPVEHSPGHLTRVPLQDVSLVGSARQKPTEQEKLDNSKESKRYFI